MARSVHASGQLNNGENKQTSEKPGIHPRTGAIIRAPCSFRHGRRKSAAITCADAAAAGRLLLRNPKAPIGLGPTILAHLTI